MWACGAVFFLGSALLLPRVWETTAVMNAVAAERGGWIEIELLHPLYTPLLALLAKALSLLGASAPHMTAFQVLSALAYGAAAAGACAFALACGADLPLAAAVPFLALAGRGAFFWSGQAKSYALATAAAFWALALLRREKPRAAALLLGVACGFTVECAGLALAFLPRRESRRELWRAGAVLAGALALVLLWKRPSLSAAHYLHQVSPGMTLWESASPLRQLRLLLGYLRNSNPDWLVAGALWTLALRKRADAGFAAASLGAAGLAAAMLAAHPHSGFLYMLPALLALAAAAQAPAVSWLRAAALAAAPALAAATLAWGALPAMREADPVAGEAAYLGAQLGAKDLLVCAGPPDWRLFYRLAGRARAVRVDDRHGWDDAFGVPRLSDEELQKEIAATLAAGGRAVLAADALFLPADLPGAAPEAVQARAQEAVLGRFRLSEPWVSPLGQRYYPLARK